MVGCIWFDISRNDQDLLYLVQYFKKLAGWLYLIRVFKELPRGLCLVRNFKESVSRSSVAADQDTSCMKHQV